MALSDVRRAVLEAHGIRKLTPEMWLEFKRRLPEVVEAITDPWAPGADPWAPGALLT
jgi:hypothetical protein